MYDSKYLPAQNVKEACALLSQYGEEAKILGGGQSLVLLLRQKLIVPSYLIDIKGISDLDYIRYDERDGLRIGALTTHRALETSPIVKEKFFMLAEMERRLASVPVRNWGTVGGNLCHADPASDLAPSLIALGAEVKLTGPNGERVVDLEEFFLGFFETVLKPDEILTEIHIPDSGMGDGIYMKFTHRETDLSIIGVATFFTPDEQGYDVCHDIRIVMGSVGSTPLRAKKAEERIRGQKVDDGIIEEAALISSEESQPTSDMNGSEAYKREIVKVLVRRTVKEAMARAMAADR